jgi:hypothetical protein
VEGLRAKILTTATDYRDMDMRIVVKSQRDLWGDGVRAGSVIGGAGGPSVPDDEEDADDPPADSFWQPIGEYRAGKWGRYLRAPDVYFDIMKRYGQRFVPLGKIATIRFGVKTGCDGFFMPKDVTDEMLKRYRTDKEFREHANGAPRAQVAAGKLKIIEAGDGSVHPIEAEYVKPEVHSLMKVDRPVVRAADLDRVVLLVGKSMTDLKSTAPWAYRYLRYGQEATFKSEKSKPVPVPQRSTCASRDPWYDVTGLAQPGIAFWPMAQQYRHIIAANPEGLICNHNLFDLDARDTLKSRERDALVAVLNSTLVGLFKTFYGRYAGTEGNLKTEVIDVNLLEVPDPQGVSADLAKRLIGALRQLARREVGHLVEEQLRDCHSPVRARRLAAGPVQLSAELRQVDRRALDDATFELLGVADPAERAALIDRLYEATARHFREIRVVEIEKMEQRKKTKSKGINAHDLAADVWDAAELPDTTLLADWLNQQPEAGDVISVGSVAE